MGIIIIDILVFDRFQILVMSNSVNVKVIVRCRPLSQREKDRNSVNIISIQDGKTVQMKNPHGGDTPKQYTFDHSYGIDSTQKEIYEQIGKPIVDSAMEGYNGAYFGCRFCSGVLVRYHLCVWADGFGENVDDDGLFGGFRCSAVDEFEYI